MGRSKNREAGILLRTTFEERERLQARAREAGYKNVQAMLEAIVLDPNFPPRQAKSAQEALPMTG